MSKIAMERLFQFQDEAAVYNVAHSERLRRLLAFVRESVALLTEIFHAMHFSAPKQHTLRVLGADAMTGIIASVRVGLWGDVPEAAALLRASLETTVILYFAVETNQYESIASELSSGRLKRHKYQSSVEGLGELGPRIARLRGALSELGAHSTGTRLKFSSYEMDGNQFDRVAAAYDPAGAELALSMVPDVCLQLLDACERAHNQDSLVLPDPHGVAALRASFADSKRATNSEAR
jgi:hypothetical protein